MELTTKEALKRSLRLHVTWTLPRILCFTPSFEQGKFCLREVYGDKENLFVTEYPATSFWWPTYEESSLNHTFRASNSSPTKESVIAPDFCTHAFVCALPWHAQRAWHIDGSTSPPRTPLNRSWCHHGNLDTSSASAHPGEPACGFMRHSHCVGQTSTWLLKIAPRV